MRRPDPCQRPRGSLGDTQRGAERGHACPSAHHHERRQCGERAIDAAPDPGLTELDRLYLAKVEEKASGEANAGKDPIAAKTHADRAIAIYKSLQKTAQHPEIRSHAAEDLDDFEDLLELQGRSARL